MGYVTEWLKVNWETVVIIAAPILYGILPLTIDHVAARCGYVILVVATYWMTEVLPLPVSGIIPVFAFPLLGVLSTGDVCMVYMKETIMMFLGGLGIAIAVEHCNLHQRIALSVILRVGQSPRRLMFGFMLTTMFLSMWISNTASTAMMIPVVEAIIMELQVSNGKREEHAMDTVDARAVTIHQDQREIAPKHVTNGISDAPVEKSEKEKSTNASGRETKSYAGGEDMATTSSSVVTLDKEHRALRDMCFMATAYSANIGGTGSLTGTGPNLVVKAVLESSFSEPTGLNFATWMAFNVPGMIVCVLLAWIWLQILYMGLGRKNSVIQQTTPEAEAAVKRLITKKYRDLGPMTHQEITVLSLFIVLVFLWLFRAPEFIPGWAGWISGNFENEVKIGGATPAMAIFFLLFILPAQPKFWWSDDFKNDKPVTPSPACITWEVVQEKMPWNLMLLLGGGFALAKGATSSGLSEWLGTQLVALEVMPKEVIVFLVCLMTAMATEVASNSATASILLPVLKEMAIKMNVNPLYLMLPSAVCCSYAFMLPVATPPNAIAFNAGKMRGPDMMKAGIVMNVVCVIVITFMINTIGVAMFDLHNVPSWINSTIVEDK